MLEISPGLSEEQLQEWLEERFGPNHIANSQCFRDFEKFIRRNTLWGVADWLRARQTPSKTLETFIESEGLERLSNTS